MFVSEGTCFPEEINLSEPNQLYLQVRISPAQLEKFLASTPGPASEFADFMEWIADKRYYGEPFTTEKLAGIGGSGTAKAWVDGWTANVYPPSINRYEEETETWTLALIEFAENYLYFIDALNTLRRIADFKDIDSTDHLLIYGYLYDGGSVTAAMQITPHNSRLLSAAPEEVIASANQTMDALLQRAGELNDD
jgi:hypothetical protein